MDDTRQCESCGAPMPRTGTYCLACDTPVSGLRAGGLSVAETDAVRRGHPVQGIALVVGCVLLLAGLTYALVMVVRPNPATGPTHHGAHKVAHSAGPLGQSQDQPQDLRSSPS